MLFESFNDVSFRKAKRWFFHFLKNEHSKSSFAVFQLPFKRLQCECWETNAKKIMMKKSNLFQKCCPWHSLMKYTLSESNDPWCQLTIMKLFKNWDFFPNHGYCYGPSEHGFIYFIFISSEKKWMFLQFAS